MWTKVSAVWMCTVVLSALLESSCTQKLHVHWGPQSMMYLKGKHGRRFASEADGGAVKQHLQGWYAVFGGIQRLQLVSKPSHIVTSTSNTNEPAVVP